MAQTTKILFLGPCGYGSQSRPLCKLFMPFLSQFAIGHIVHSASFGIPCTSASMFYARIQSRYHTTLSKSQRRSHSRSEAPAGEIPLPCLARVLNTSACMSHPVPLTRGYTEAQPCSAPRQPIRKSTHQFSPTMAPSSSSAAQSAVTGRHSAEMDPLRPPDG